ncbi:30S ribosomal protein S19 [Candidatus Bandiella euplotis]|uniref:Small ribosomal subunit protein uS19 n=1 Tax=Candidatus Bandiella euplotis TaxID=1664265 RepID=A0ABZ0UPZ6_9RICK|nr:30S ribosomal protein S19 [Candidatus Bandiella woodruffii]WPX96778.1 30S ribosomal protein S19 [Candidatus Bandiella woodruffii]
MGNRSVWKGPFVEPKLLEKVNNAISGGKYTVVKTWSRSSTILPNFVGLTFSVYNGKKFVPVLVNEKMVGKKLGEFAPTRIFTGHGNNRK